MASETGAMRDGLGARRRGLAARPLHRSLARAPAGAYPPGASAPDEMHPHRSLPPHGPPHVLLVEDDPATARAVRRLLALHGYVVHVAGTIAEAGRVAARQPLDLVICDLQLPDGDGLDIPERLRAQLERRRADDAIEATPAIVLSALATPDVHARSRARRFAAHLDKPVDDEVLVATIRRVIAASGGPEARGATG